MPSRSKWPGDRNPWEVWNLRPRPIQREPEREPAEADTTVSLAGVVLSGHKPTDAEANSLAGAVLSAKARV